MFQDKIVIIAGGTGRISPFTKDRMPSSGQQDALDIPRILTIWCCSCAQIRPVLLPEKISALTADKHIL